MVAGRSDALWGLTGGAVSAPVIACLPPSDAFAGLDVFSFLRTPSGIAPAEVLEPLNTAFPAARILGRFIRKESASAVGRKYPYSSKRVSPDCLKCSAHGVYL
jgi:phosphoribosylcarboxyaminoimidazole (NCAIR) mutase